MKKVGVSQKVIVLNKGGNFLALHRTNSAPSNPDKWDFPGGDLGFGEDTIEGIKREVKEEAGLEVENLKPFDVESHVNKRGEFWITIAYTAKTVSGKVTLSFEHDDFKWLTAEEFLQLESPDKLKRFVRNLNKMGSNPVIQF